MGQVRECSECGRRLYSLALANWVCGNGQHATKDCKGVMRLLNFKDRPRNRFKVDGTKLGEFW